VKKAILIAVLAAFGAFAPGAASEQRRTELVSAGTSEDAFYGAASGDGRRAAYTTGSAVTPADTDGLCDRGFDSETGEPYPPTPCRDVYVRDLVARTTKLVSTGSTGGSAHVDAGFLGISRDGRRVLFQTTEQLTAQDMDTANDVYSRNVDTDTTNLVSTGPTGGNGPVDVFTGRWQQSADGTRIFFDTQEALTSDDTNDLFDAYVRDLSTGTTQVVSTDGSDAVGGATEGISEDGSKAFFRTVGSATANDTDQCPGSSRGCADVYERDLGAGRTTLVSTGPRGGQPGFDAEFAGASPDGSRVYFHTAEPLTADDTDLPETCPAPPVPSDPFTNCVDVYERAAGQTTLISTGPAKNAGDPAPSAFYAATADGSRIYFHTAEPLVAGDPDYQRDVYVRDHATTVLVSDTQTADPIGYGAVPAGIARGGDEVFLATYQRWTGTDTDAEFDLYSKSSSGFRQASIGSIGGNGHNSSFGELATDTGRLFFTTTERLVPEDTQAFSQDIYQWLDGETTLISTGPTAQSFFASANRQSAADGGRRFFFNAGNLVPEDTDAAGDVYVSIAGGPPDCEAVRPDRAVLWPANRKFRIVMLSGATDPDGDAVAISVTGVTQDEPVRGAPDARYGRGEDEVRLRAEREPRRDGRVYRIAFEATDTSGESCSGTVTVSVPRKKKQAAVDSAPPSYDSFGH
jgi:hypothetical protein